MPELQNSIEEEEEKEAMEHHDHLLHLVRSNEQHGRVIYSWQIFKISCCNLELVSRSIISHKNKFLNLLSYKFESQKKHENYNILNQFSNMEKINLIDQNETKRRQMTFFYLQNLIDTNLY